MSKNPNTFAKRQREMEKKRKAEDKRSRRRERKDQVDSGEVAVQVSDELDDDTTLDD